MNKIKIISFLIAIGLIVVIVIPITFIVPKPYSSVISFFIGMIMMFIEALYIRPLLKKRIEIRK